MRFFVGQRVRLARPYDNRFLGIQGTIVDIFEVHQAFCSNAGLQVIDCSVLWDDAADCWQRTDQLEPLSDSNTLASWSDAENVWVPEHLREVKA